MKPNTVEHLFMLLRINGILPRLLKELFGQYFGAMNSQNKQ